MSNVFFCSDHHLTHSNLLNFKRADGVTPLRSFENIDEHDEYIIQQHNSVVTNNCRVYFLGDVTFSKKHLYLLDRMKGRKVLIKGNHDTLDLKDYLPYFDDIRAFHQFDGLCMAHIPIHTESLGRWGCQVHGHLHANRVMTSFGTKIDERYQNVSMECLDDYTPISLEEMKSRLIKLNVLPVKK